MGENSQSNSFVLADLINQILLDKTEKNLYTNCGASQRIAGVFPGIEKKSMNLGDKPLKNSLCYLEINSKETCEAFLVDLEKTADYIIYCPIEMRADIRLSKMQRCSLDFCGMEGDLYLYGRTFSGQAEEVPRDFKVLAIIHCYNEVDVIEKTINYLLEQEIDLYMVDNWSTDGSYEKIVKMAKLYPERIFCERFPEGGKTDYYDWYHQMERSEQIACMTEYNWYMHYDADEIHISPWKGLNLREAIYKVEQLGYNTIDNTVIDFKLTEKNSDRNIFAEDTYFCFGDRIDHFMQRKTWKKSESVDLKSTGGHIAKISNNKTSVLNFLNKHYPLRSLEQAEKKIFVERKPRFEKEQKERGWHTHYDDIQKRRDIIVDSEQCILWDENTFDNLYLPLFLNVNYNVEKKKEQEEFGEYCEKRIVIYGAGKKGEELFLGLYRKAHIVAWVDKNYENIKEKFFSEILSVDKIKELEFECCIIANAKKEIQDQIKKELQYMKVPNEKIYVYPVKKEND